MTAPYDVVVPTAGRPELARLLRALAVQDGPPPGRVVVVDDRSRPEGPLLAAGELAAAAPVAGRLVVVRGPARGPAAARNAGWRVARAAWVAFLDDDVVPPAGWAGALAADLATAGDDVAGSQGRIVVPLPPGRRPTDWERNVAGLEGARWATADLAYRRAALVAAGGFDERFPRAYREDSDLGLRLVRAGWRIVPGTRWVEHPVRPAGARVSLRLQAGNADDVRMRVLHGRHWREASGAPPGRLPRHLTTAAAGAAAAGAFLARRPGAGAAAAALWAAGTLELAWARIAPGPRTPLEVATMLATSAAMPFVAAWHRARGEVSMARERRRQALAPADGARVGVRPVPGAVLFDRDDTLIADVPYNGDPDRVQPFAGARAALDRLRAAGIPVGLVSNQSGVGRGLLTRAQVDAVNARVEALLGPFAAIAVCPHAPDQGCACRKPAPGLVHEAARALGVEPRACAVVGDIGADVGAAAAAGARGILVPTPRTLPEEVAAAPERAPDLEAAVDLLLGAPVAAPADESLPQEVAA